MENAQILDNKRTRLQTLIDMFEHQSDTFLLNHQPTNNVPMSPLHDYSEYDHADDIDEFGQLEQSDRARPNRFNANAANESGINAEDICLPLPSSLGWKWCVDRGLKTLADKEAKLRFAQATDSVHKIRLALGFKSALFRDDIRHSRSKKTKTRAWAAVRTVDASVHEHAQNYSMARDAYTKVLDPSGESPELPRLQLADLRIDTSVLGAGEVGQRNKQLPWIWSFGTSEMQDGPWTDECKCSAIPEILTILSDGTVNRVHWLRAKAQFERWKEEQDSIRNEAVWVPAYFHTMAEHWKARIDFAVQGDLSGHAAYASRQAYAWEELSISAKKALTPITSAA